MKWIDRWRMFGTKVDSIGNSCCPLNTCYYIFSFHLHHMVAQLHQPAILHGEVHPSISLLCNLAVVTVIKFVLHVLLCVSINCQDKGL